MEFTISRSPFQRQLGMALVCSLLSLPALAAQPDQETQNHLPAAGLMDSRFEVSPSLELFEQRSQRSRGLFDLQDFYSRYSEDWEVRWDRRNDRPNMIQGVGIPLLSGQANPTGPLARLGKGQTPSLEAVSERLLEFVSEHPSVLRVDHLDLRLDRERSTSFGDDAFFWHIEFQQYHQGVPVDGAYIYFRLNHGNLVQFGAHRVAEIEVDTKPALSRSAAFRQVQESTGLARSVMREDADRGGVRIYPILGDDEHAGQNFAGSPGFGYGHLLVWELFYRVDEHPYKAVIDAASGDILEHIDLRDFGAESIGAEFKKAGLVTGQIFPNSSADALVSVPLPFLNVSTSEGTRTTDSKGQYPYPGGTATAYLSGPLAEISDDCGDSFLSSTDGRLDFGGAPGTNCSTPAQGGQGNTNAARTTFYHLNQIHSKAASFLPENSWLTNPLVAEVNLAVGEPGEQHCNAYWDGSQVAFFPAGSGCSNTGEIAAIIVHEWGHGMDQNAGGVPSERGSREATGDTFAFLETGEACIGTHFQPGQACHNCRNSCRGVRDLDAFALGGQSTIAQPNTITSNSGLDCDRFLKYNGAVNCPFRTDAGLGFPYQGPMGYQGHCESLIASTANWDLAQALQAEHGSAAGLEKMNDIWYGSLTPAGSAYRLASGGQCNPNASVDGCGHDNWYTLYLAVDDDDGNLLNGTPNGCRIWDAFNAHGIACGTRPACSNPNQRPVASFTDSCNGLSCTFDASSSSDDNEIVSFSWIFGDGNTGSGVQPNHVYAAPGSYSVKLTVTDNDGASDSQTRMVNVQDPPNAAFSSSCNGLTCSFDASASNDNGTIVSYAWNFGDGANGSGVQTSHTYTSSGSYDVTLTVTDNHGETDSSTQTVDPDPPCSVLSFNVQNSSSGLPVVSWSTTCPHNGSISVQVKTSTLSFLPPACRLSDDLWDGSKNGSRTADYMAGGYGPTSSCPAVPLSEFWVELRDTSHGGQLIESTTHQQASYNPPPLPCDLTSFSVTNRSAGLLPIISWSTTCPDPGPVSVQVRTSTLSQNLPAACRLDDALWDGNKNGSRTVDFMAGGYGNGCPFVGQASFWVELWQGTQLIRRSSYRTATYMP